MSLERTENSHTKRKLREQSRGFEFGEVVQVHEHTADDDTSNHEVDIILRDENHQRRRAPIMQATGGSAVIPQEGDPVLVGFLSGDTDSPVVVGHLPTVENRPPKGTAGTIRQTRGDLYTEMAPDGSYARVAKKTDDDVAPDAKVEVDNTGTITIETAGDIRISAAGQVTIDEGGTTQSVAVQNHTHDFTKSDGTSGTTGSPNEAGTNTEVE